MTFQVRANAHQLAEAINTVAYATLLDSEPEHKLTVLQYLRLRAEARPVQLKVVASDGYRMAQSIIPYTQIGRTDRKDQELLLPLTTAHALVQLARSCNTTSTIDLLEPWSVGGEDKSLGESTALHVSGVRIMSDGLDVTVPIGKGLYPNMDRIVADPDWVNGARIRVWKSRLLKTLGMVARKVSSYPDPMPITINITLGDDKDALLELWCNGCYATLEAKALGMGDWKGSLQYDTRHFHLRVEAVYLAQAMEFCQGDALDIWFPKALSCGPLRITMEDSPHAIHIIKQLVD